MSRHDVGRTDIGEDEHLTDRVNALYERWAGQQAVATYRHVPLAPVDENADHIVFLFVNICKQKNTKIKANELKINYMVYTRTPQHETENLPHSCIIVSIYEYEFKAEIIILYELVPWKIMYTNQENYVVKRKCRRVALVKKGIPGEFE